MDDVHDKPMKASDAAPNADMAHEAPADELPSRDATLHAPLSPLAIVAIAYAIFDFLCMPLAMGMSRGADQGIAVFMAMGAGAFTAQFGVLPAWLVWGERPFWQ